MWFCWRQRQPARLQVRRTGQAGPRLQPGQAGRSIAAASEAALSTSRRLPPGLQRPATRTRTKPELAQPLLRVARRYAETETVRATGAFLAVVAVAVLAVLAWLWVFGK